MASTTVFSAVASLTTVLPSTFTPYMSCVREIYLVDAPEETCFQGTKPTPCSYFHLGAPTNTAKCFPKEWRPSNDSYMSPAACPRKYTVACAEIGAKETIATCCPDDGSQGTYDCVRDLEYDFMATDRCSRKIAKTVEFLYTTSTLGQTETTVITTSGADQVIYAYGAEVRWQSSDFTSTASKTSSITSEIETPNTELESKETSDKNRPTESAESEPASSGLSTPAKAGIGAVAGIAGICLLVGIALLWWRYRRQPNQETPQITEVDRPEDSYDEAMKQKEIVQISTSDYSSAGTVPQEYPPWMRHEIDGEPKFYEVDGYATMRVREAEERRTPIAELESPCDEIKMYR